MPFVTVQLGQCGNQMGAAWFDTLAEELAGGGYGATAHEAYFQEQQQPLAEEQAGRQRWRARAVLVDMEPKVIKAAKQRAAGSKHGWCYGGGCSAAGQSGSGNNWALGHNKFGPAMAPAVLELVRKQVEACDVCEGFVMLQSLAGGTGAGAGTFLAEALVDEYANAHMLNCCIWPYESGEVTVQPYNTLLSMSSLAQLSSGILLLQNEALHATCSRLLGIKHPRLHDLNSVAARALASALLPCRSRPAGPASDCGSSGGGAAPDHSGGSGPLLSPVCDLTCHVFSHPSHRVAGLRCVPQLPPASLEFTTLSWRTQLARLKAMSLAGVYLDEHLSSFMASEASRSLPLHKYKNRAASALLVLRGRDAGTVPAGEFCDPHCYATWAVNPLAVAAHPAKFGSCHVSATLLATDQSCVAPMRPMLATGYSMLASRAYTHQYEAYGLSADDFQHCFAVAEDVLGSYAGLG